MTYAEGNGSVYYQDTRGNWFRDNFTKDGVFQETNSLTLSEVRNEEAVHDLDLDGDGNTGDIVTDIYFNVPDSNVEIDDPMDNWGLYKTETNAYLIDVYDLYTGSQTIAPSILINETISRGKITKSLYKFQNMPISATKMKMEIT